MSTRKIHTDQALTQSLLEVHIRGAAYAGRRAAVCIVTGTADVVPRLNML